LAIGTLNTKLFDGIKTAIDYTFVNVSGEGKTNNFLNAIE